MKNNKPNLKVMNMKESKVESLVFSYYLLEKKFINSTITFEEQARKDRIELEYVKLTEKENIQKEGLFVRLMELDEKISHKKQRIKELSYENQI